MVVVSTKELMVTLLAVTVHCASYMYVAGQGCSNRCPPNNYGVIVPALCEGDYIDGDTNMNGQYNVKADIDHTYDVCYPTDSNGPLQFTLNDFRGPSNTVTVIANYYTGCNAGKRESGVFAHVAQRYYDLYGPDKVHFVQSVKGGGTCRQWASIYQDDAEELYPSSNVRPYEMPWSVDDTSYKLRDEFFTSPFGHPAYVVLDGTLQIKHKFIGPCCGYEYYEECTPTIARTLDTTLSGYLDAILQSAPINDNDNNDDNSVITTAPPTRAPTATPKPVDSLDCSWSMWSPCSVRCGSTPGIQIRYKDLLCSNTSTTTTATPVFESRACLSDISLCDEPCLPELGEQYTITTTHTGFDSPRDVKFHPTPGYHTGTATEGRTFVHPPDGDEAWIINGNNHTISIVTAVGHPVHQSSFPRRDRGHYHYMINGTAISFNSVKDSGRTSDRDTYNYWSICNDNNNNYLDTKEANYFMGPTLYDSSSENYNLVNKMGDVCDPNTHEECYFLHSDMLHESPSCRGIVHDPELETSYGTVYWAFDSTGNRDRGQLVRYDFQQPHGPGSMDHSIASVRRYVEIELESTEEATIHAGIHAGMVIHPRNRHLYMAVPGQNRILKVDIDSGRFARTAREEYPIFSNRLPSFEYSIWECVEQAVYLEYIDTPSGLAFSADYERLFVAERGSGNILVFDVDTGDLLTTIATQFKTIGGMAISPKGGALYFVDDDTGTLNSVSVEADCVNSYAVRTDPGYLTALDEARLVLDVGNPFTLEDSYQECFVDPIVPDAAFFDQVHVDTGYASDNPDVQSNHTGMDEAAALLANRTDCGYDSELNFDALLLGGYFCHTCLPEQDLACPSGGSCTNIQWTGYICDNEFKIIDDATTTTTTNTNNNNDPEGLLLLPGSTYRIQTLNGTNIDPSTLVLKKGVEYTFQIEVDEEVCLSALREKQLVRSDEKKIGSASGGGYTRGGDSRTTTTTGNNEDVVVELVHLGCSARNSGPLLISNAGQYELTGPRITNLDIDPISEASCVNEKFCSNFLSVKKNRGRDCAKDKNVATQEGSSKSTRKVRELCPKTCKKHLCTCNDRVKPFTIRRTKNKNKMFTCQTLNPKKCNKKTSFGFKVWSVCPNKCNKTNKCIANK